MMAVIPKEWNRGRIPIMQAPGTMVHIHAPTWMALETQLKWLSTAALGTPVVPPVMM